MVPDNPKTAVIRALPLRTGAASHLPGDGRPLRHRDLAGAGQESLATKPRSKRGCRSPNGRLLAALRDQRFFSVARAQPSDPAAAGPSSTPSRFRSWKARATVGLRRRKRPALLAVARRSPLSWPPGPRPRSTSTITWSWITTCYSVPYPLVHQELEARLTAHHRRVLSPRQARGRSPAQLRRRASSPPWRNIGPRAHQRYLEWTPSRLGRMGAQDRPAVRPAGGANPARTSPIPNMGFRSCLGIIRLGKGVGPERLEAACARALRFGTCSYQSIKSILENGLDRQRPWSPNCPCPVRPTRTCAAKPITPEAQARSYAQSSNHGKTPRACVWRAWPRRWKSNAAKPTSASWILKSGFALLVERQWLWRGEPRAGRAPALRATENRRQPWRTLTTAIPADSSGRKSINCAPPNGSPNTTTA